MDRLRKRLWREEKGQNVSEFALLMVLLALLGASVAGIFGLTVRSACWSVYAAVAKASSSASNTADSGPKAIEPSTEDTVSTQSNGSGAETGNLNGTGTGPGETLAPERR